ncbi:hypothetical protein LTR48_002345 [Friedmanniomyces endolithicus]|uniref:AAA+ ATPase domain-containing protein n=1 Tax=Rachicladosporium monterosium TaxID=1507873 RepID=A0ABR0LBE7_9PEZI|nr:hypothetical protein LTR48_002345 [Friedmanniomyces endolithicus]KAK5146319.1 hypothetical protein LTR32_002072 [Rachicladosporium monterosium]
MRLAVRQSLRLACNQRASSRSRVRHTGDAVVPPIRSFTSSARQTSDIRPPNGTPDQSTWQEHQHEQQRRAEDGVVEPDPERSTAKADLGDAKVAGESRKPLRRTLRQVPPARRTPEVPKPPPIPEWFLKHNVYLAKDTASDLGAREVLRCVDAATGHTLFTVPYYEPPELPTTTAVRGKDVDVSSLDLKKDVLSGLPDHLKEQMMIHHLQVQRAKRPEEISQEGLAELLVALPRDMQEEILRREAVEEKRTKLNERVEHVDAGPPRTKDTTKRTSKARNTLGQDFFAQKGPASQNPSLPTIGSTHNSATLKRLDGVSYPPMSWLTLEAEMSLFAALSLPKTNHPSHHFSSSRVDISLSCPDPEASRSMDLLVNQLAESVNADVIKFDANDFEDLLSEFVDGGRDTPGSFSNLGYDVFEGMQAHGVGSSQKNIFGNSHEEMEEDEDDDDDMEEDEDDDNSNDHSSGGVEFGTMDDLRKALQDKRGEFGKVLSGMGIAGITVGMPKMMAGFGGAPPPGMTAPRQSKIWREDEDGDVRYNVARLTALLDGLLDAGKLRRQSVPAGELGATDHGTGRVVGAHVERVSTAQMLASYIATSSVAAETHAQSDVVRPVHIALATVVTAHVDKLVQAWTTRDRMSKASKNFGMGSGGVGKEKNVSTEEAKPTKIDEVRSSCNHHETKLLTGVVDAKNIKTGFSDVHAPASTIEALKTLTSLSLLRPEAFTYGVLANDRLPGLLLYGPPGTGKTLLAKAVAKESKATVLEVTGAQIYEKYVGEGEKMVRAVFSLAKKLTPCVVFIDEADAIFGSRSGSGGGNRNTHREIINQFLREWDGMDDRGVFVMVASNRPFDLDDAVLRRLPRRVLVDLPAARDRESILGIHLKNEILDSGVQLAKLAAQTPLYSGSDLKNLCVAAALAAVREENELALSHAGEEGFKLPEKRTLMPSHFETAVKEISASISEDMSSLGAIRKFDEQFGDRKGRKKKAGYGFGAGGSGEEVVDERSVMVRVPDGPSVTPTPP